MSVLERSNEQRNAMIMTYLAATNQEIFNLSGLSGHSVTPVANASRSLNTSPDQSSSVNPN